MSEYERGWNLLDPTPPPAATSPFTAPPAMSGPDSPVDALFVVPVQERDSDERFTPRWVFEGLGVIFDLDPASPIDGGDYVPARNKLTRDDDGLARDWHGLVWLNPPFSEATAWADKFRLHGNGIFLGPVANSRWWIDLAGVAGLIWLCRDIAFVHPEHAGRRSSMPLAFIAMGDGTTPLVRLASSGRHAGVLVNLWGAA